MAECDERKPELSKTTIASTAAAECANNLLADSGQIPPRRALDRPAAKSEAKSGEQSQKQLAEVKTLLGPTIGSWWNDHRIQSDIDKSDKAALSKPITKEEFQKGRELLKLPSEQSDDQTRQEIAKFVGLSDKARDVDIRTKLAIQHDYNLGNSAPHSLEMTIPLELTKPIRLLSEKKK